MIMNRLTGIEEGYHLRYDVTQKLMDNKSSMISFMQSMANLEYYLSNEERLLLARVDSAIDDVLHVYHKIVLDIDAK